MADLVADDTPEDRTTLIKRILSAKLFDDEASGGAWKRNVKDTEGEILCGAALPIPSPPSSLASC